MQLHQYLASVMILLVLVAGIMFVAYYSFLCGSGDETFCTGLHSEIMLTGYAITGLSLLIAVTSYARHMIPYELFRGVHHFVYLIYLLAIIHTIDGKQRSGQRNRSQTFTWVSVSLLYFACDKAVQYINHRYKVPMLASTPIDGLNGSHAILLNLRRPTLFDFKPGQYAMLRLREVDNQWHPFSIASGPESSTLEFYIEVMSEGSWTHRLFDLLKKVEQHGIEKEMIEFEVMGPFGTGLANSAVYSHMLAIGSGTGKLKTEREKSRPSGECNPTTHALPCREQFCFL
jgi:predicted ferric reductase